MAHTGLVASSEEFHRKYTWARECLEREEEMLRLLQQHHQPRTDAGRTMYATMIRGSRRGIAHAEQRLAHVRAAASAAVGFDAVADWDANYRPRYRDPIDPMNPDTSADDHPQGGTH